MKETVKASIGGYAFILDVDAYQVLNSYLENLKVYFRNKSDGAEIISDIEARMSELLLLKISQPSDIITHSDAVSIIEVMGNPADFVDSPDEDADQQQPVSSPNKTPIEKKLYRDKSNAILGGVCSGLGQYFRVDPVIVRIIYGLSFIIANSIYDKLSLIIFMSYILLWIAMPQAKTFKQKLAMSGQDPSIIEGLESGSLKTKEMRGSGLGRILKKLLKVMLGLFLICVSLCVLLGAFVGFFYPSVLGVPSVSDLLESSGLFTPDIVVSMTLLWVIPVFMIMFSVIRLLIRFTTRDFLILGIAFVVWIGVCLNLGVRGAKYAKDYKHEAHVTEKYTPAIESDTLYIRLDDEYKLAEMVLDTKELYMIDGETKSWFVNPVVQVRKDSVYKNIEIEINKTAFGRSWKVAEDKAKNAKIELREDSSAIYLKPHLYNKYNLWDRELFEFVIYCPENKTVILDYLMTGRFSNWGH